MCNPVEITIGVFGQIDLSKFDTDSVMMGKFTIPLRLVTPGSPYQMTRGALAEEIMLALESGLADYLLYVNELRSKVDLEPTKLKFDYRNHQVNE